MKKALLATAIIVLFTGCTASHTPSSTQQLARATFFIASTATTSESGVSPSPSPTPGIKQEATTPEQTEADTETPKPTPDPSFKPVPPGPGLPIGEMVVSDKNYIFYYDDCTNKDCDKVALYKIDRQSNKRTILEAIQYKDFQMQQIFIDRNENLYYVIAIWDDTNSEYSIYLYRYQKPKDQLIAVRSMDDDDPLVKRVDANYIYTSNIWYSLDDYKPVHRTDDYITWQDGIDTINNKMLQKKQIDPSAYFFTHNNKVLYYITEDSDIDDNFTFSVHSYDTQTGITRTVHRDTTGDCDSNLHLDVCAGYLWIYWTCHGDCFGCYGLEKLKIG